MRTFEGSPTEAQLANAYSECDRCGGRTLFLSVETIGKPGFAGSITTASICTECVASFRAWWRQGQDD